MKTFAMQTKCFTLTEIAMQNCDHENCNDHENAALIGVDVGNLNA